MDQWMDAWGVGGRPCFFARADQLHLKEEGLPPAQRAAAFAWMHCMDARGGHGMDQWMDAWGVAGGAHACLPALTNYT